MNVSVLRLLLFVSAKKDSGEKDGNREKIPNALTSPATQRKNTFSFVPYFLRYLRCLPNS